jgi:hypothetical protein
MPHYSEIHRDISEVNKNQDILTNPEKYFGPNYKILLNFWLYYDELSREQMGKFSDVYCKMYLRGRDVEYITHFAKQYCRPYIEEQLDDLDRELLAADLIIASGKSLIFPRVFEQL